MTYVYPKLPATYLTTPYFRIGGNGLANCLYVYARAIVLAKKFDAKIITPPWLNIVISGYVHHRKDKRHYIGLFNRKGEISGIKKFFLLLFKRKSSEEDPMAGTIIVVDGLQGYFEDILYDNECVREVIYSQIDNKVKCNVDEFDFNNCIGVHVRLGDYSPQRRTPLIWYATRIKEYPSKRILVFSDGTDEELSLLLEIPNVERAFFGNAIADIFALSKCEFIIGSDSTFSGWGAYLGQVPCRFYKKHYGRVLSNQIFEVVDNV